ncbi:heme exporter protein CcmD [uncultured Alsobacter sp.]|uniref:heme exporter protein CcmD n=1 Tax=uncultured Alsobacter sp. TaxID=1748258 RepID=UPI0025FB8F02|nr:heme exporter protein CcmD [uncultured Alsobacter sp.]
MTHAGYIIAAYAAAVLVIGALVVRTLLDHRSLKATLAQLESRGVRRRSERDA